MTMNEPKKETFLFTSPKGERVIIQRFFRNQDETDQYLKTMDLRGYKIEKGGRES